MERSTILSSVNHHLFTIWLFNNLDFLWDLAEKIGEKPDVFRDLTGVLCVRIVGSSSPLMSSFYVSGIL